MHTSIYRKLSIGFVVAGIIIASPHFSFAKESQKNTHGKIEKTPKTSVASFFSINDSQATSTSPDASTIDASDTSTSTSSPSQAQVGNSDQASTSTPVTSSPSSPSDTSLQSQSLDATGTTSTSDQVLLSPATDTSTRTIRRQQYHDATTTPVTISPTTTAAGTVVIGSNPDQTEPTPSQPDLPAATDYYPPLDSLSPEATYTYSFLAMALGIAGAFSILRKPREKRAWVTGLQTKTLLEP